MVKKYMNKSIFITLKHRNLLYIFIKAKCMCVKEGFKKPTGVGTDRVPTPVGTLSAFIIIAVQVYIQYVLGRR